MFLIKLWGYFTTFLYALAFCYCLGVLIEGWQFDPNYWEPGTLQAMMIVLVMIFGVIKLTSHVDKHHKSHKDYEEQNKKY